MTGLSFGILLVITTLYVFLKVSHGSLLNPAGEGPRTWERQVCYALLLCAAVILASSFSPNRKEATYDAQRAYSHHGL